MGSPTVPGDFKICHCSGSSSSCLTNDDFGGDGGVVSSAGAYQKVRARSFQHTNDTCASALPNYATFGKKLKTPRTMEVYVCRRGMDCTIPIEGHQLSMSNTLKIVAQVLT